jgi:hypothetical protein
VERDSKCWRGNVKQRVMLCVLAGKAEVLLRCKLLASFFHVDMFMMRVLWNRRGRGIPNQRSLGHDELFLAYAWSL